MSNETTEEVLFQSDESEYRARKHERSGHISIFPSDRPEFSAQGEDLEVSFYGDVATVWLWTTKADLSLCMNIPPSEGARFVRLASGKGFDITLDP